MNGNFVWWVFFVFSSACSPMASIRIVALSWVILVDLDKVGEIIIIWLLKNSCAAAGLKNWNNMGCCLLNICLRSIKVSSLIAGREDDILSVKLDVVGNIKYHSFGRLQIGLSNFRRKWVNNPTETSEMFSFCVLRRFVKAGVRKQPYDCWLHTRYFLGRLINCSF